MNSSYGVFELRQTNKNIPLKAINDRSMSYILHLGAQKNIFRLDAVAEHPSFFLPTINYSLVHLFTYIHHNAIK